MFAYEMMGKSCLIWLGSFRFVVRGAASYRRKYCHLDHIWGRRSSECSESSQSKFARDSAGAVLVCCKTKLLTLQLQLGRRLIARYDYEVQRETKHQSRGCSSLLFPRKLSRRFPRKLMDDYIYIYLTRVCSVAGARTRRTKTQAISIGTSCNYCKGVT
jgi:hypothetical protein